MTRIFEFLISLLIVAIVFVVIGLFLPAERVFSHSIETNRPMSTVNDLFNGFGRFKDWNPLVRHDPRMAIEISGPVSGVGAKFSYVSKDKVVGTGSWEITESVPGESITYKLTNPSSGSDKAMTISLERTGQGNKNVKISQEYRVNYGWDLPGRFAGLYVSRDVGDDIKRGLAKFSSMLASIPKYDYTQHKESFSIVEVPAQNFLFVSTTANRSSDEIATAMENQYSWIKKVMEANGLVADGSLRVISNEFTSESYGFDVVVPVRLADAPAGAPAGEKLSLLMQGPVSYDQTLARRVATTDYIGPAPGLPRVRDMLRAWAVVHGSDTDDRPYEEYLGGISTMSNEDAKFKVYWPIK